MSDNQSDNAPDWGKLLRRAARSEAKLIDKPAPTEIHSCSHDRRFSGVFFLPPETHGCVACAFEQSLKERDELREAVEHLRREVSGRPSNELHNAAIAELTRERDMWKDTIAQRDRLVKGLRATRGKP